MSKVTLYREKLRNVVGCALLYIVPDRLPRLLRPVQARFKGRCAISGSVVYPGDFVYPCYENPVRLAPGGPAKCHIDKAQSKGQDVLPEGVIVVPIPTTEAVMDLPFMKSSKRELQAKLEKAATKMLKSGAQAKI